MTKLAENYFLALGRGYIADLIFSFHSVPQPQKVYNNSRIIFVKCFLEQEEV